MNFIFLISPAVVNEKLFYLLSRFQRKLKARFEPFQNRKIIFQIFLFPPQLTKNIPDFSIQVHYHNNAKDLH
jgi:hypothetical protein